MMGRWALSEYDRVMLTKIKQLLCVYWNLVISEIQLKQSLQ